MPSHAIPFQALPDVELTSQQLFAIWQPAWPTRRVQSQHDVACFIPWRRGGQGAWAACGIGVNIPFKLMTSRMFAEWLCVMGDVEWRGVEEEVSRATRWWAEDGLVRWRQRCGREVFTPVVRVGRFLVCCAGGLSKFGSASGSHPCPWQGRRIVRSDLLSRYLLFTPHRPAYSLQLCEVNMNVT
jgi:hypothetical protein